MWQTHFGFSFIDKYFKINANMASNKFMETPTKAGLQTISIYTLSVNILQIDCLVLSDNMHQTTEGIVVTSIICLEVN